MAQLITTAADVDGVLLDFLKGFENTAHKVLGRQISRRNNAWCLADAYNLTMEERDEVWNSFHHHKTLRELPPMPGALEAIERLQDVGCALHAVTALPPEYADDREANLRDLGFKGDIYVVGDQPKTPVLRQLNPVFFVDDQLLHLHAAPFIPNRVWIRTPQEQFSKANGAHTHEAHSFLEFTAHWLEGRHHQLAI